MAESPKPLKGPTVKNYSVLVAKTNAALRHTSTFTHAVKHAAFASELRISVHVRDNRTNAIVITIEAIDKAHAIKAQNRRDKRYARIARKGN